MNFHKESLNVLYLAISFIYVFSEVKSNVRGISEKVKHISTSVDVLKES